MARKFVAASSEYLQVESGLGLAYPFTMACWANVDAEVGCTLMAVQQKASDNEFHMLEARGGDANNTVNAASHATAAAADALTSTFFSINTWFHAAGVFNSATSRSSFLNGGGKVTSATNATPASLDRYSVGALRRLTPAGYMSGKIAEAAIWNVALSDAQITLLAGGANPLSILPGNLIHYTPLWGNSSPEPNNGTGSTTLTATGTVKSDHPTNLVRPFPTTFNNYQFPSASSAGIISVTEKIR